MKLFLWIWIDGILSSVCATDVKDFKSIMKGSSPRLWGTLFWVQQAGLTARIIPTPVGNTPHVMQQIGIIADHPHACGEHNPASHVACLSCGSSPRLWGTHKEEKKAEAKKRIIPTPVGNTKKCGFVFIIKPDHPHACGEHE